MSAAEYLFQMVRGVPVVTSPAEIDMTTAGQLRAILCHGRARGHPTVVVDMTGRACEQCGTVFVPQREHARFCSADCRAAWNREHMGDPAVDASALAWSLTAMSEAAERLRGVPAWDRPRAFAAIGEAVWWITMARYRAYQAYLVGHAVGETFGRSVTFLTLTGADAASATVTSADTRW